MKRILSLSIYYIIILLVSYFTVLYLYDFKSANSLLIGYLISCVDLILLTRFMYVLMKKSSSSGAVIMSSVRWGFVGICIFLSLVYLKVTVPLFVIGIILPFAGVLLIVIYYIFRRKENG